VNVRHLVPFAGKAYTSAQLFFSGFNSFSTVHPHVILGCPLFLVPCGFHSSAAFVILLGGFLSVCPTPLISSYLSLLLLFMWKWLDDLERMTNGQKLPTKADLPVPTSGTAGYGKMERPRTPLALKEQVLRLNLDYVCGGGGGDDDDDDISMEL
jgi:hypothetical protein